MYESLNINVVCGICKADKETMGSKAYDCLKDKYSTEIAYNIIMKNM